MWVKALPLVLLAIAVGLIGVHLCVPKTRTWVWKVLAVQAARGEEKAPGPNIRELR